MTMPINLYRTDTRWKTTLSAPLEERHLIARPLADSDLEAVYCILKKPEIYRFIPDLDDGGDGITWFDRTRGKRTHLYVSLILKEPTRLVGVAVLNEEPAQTLRMGGFIDSSHWGRGLASEWVHGLLDRFQATRLAYRIHADVDTNNTAACRLLESFGFRKAGPVGENRIDYCWQPDRI
jgi:RimJ/RimL family protein N-acetyltransferase